MDPSITVPEPALDEQARLAALHACEILDTLPESAFEDLVDLAQQVCGTPAAAISFIDSERQWLKAARGLAGGVAREHAFCNHTIKGPETLVVDDASRDPRFRDNPYVAGAPGLRFYAGVPLVTSEGARVGALCVLDCAPRSLDRAQRAMLEILGRQVSAQLELRRQKAALQEALGERDAALARLEVSEAIRRAVAQAEGLEAAARGAVATVGVRLGWAAGAVWRAPAQGGALACIGGYWLSRGALAPLEEASRHVAFVAGVGLPGAVWRAKSSLWLESLIDEPGMPRLAALRAAGLASGVAVPLFEGGRVAGVLELFAERARRQDASALALLEHAGRELGALLTQRAKDDAARAVEVRHAALVRASAEAIVVIDERGRIAAWNPAAATLFGAATFERPGASWEGLLPPSEHAPMRELVAAARAGGPAEPAPRAYERLVERAPHRFVVRAMTWDATGGDGVALLFRDAGEAR